MLTEQEQKDYAEQGYLLKPDYIAPDQLNEIIQKIEQFAQNPHESYVYENDHRTLRSIDAPHLLDEYFEDLAQSPCFEAAAAQLVGESVYVYQYKIHFKNRFNEQYWQWHTDYYFWQQEAGMLRDDALTLIIFLDEITPHNGPMFLAPRSHKTFIGNDLIRSPYVDQAPNWRQSDVTELQYPLDKDFLAEIIEKNGWVAATGQAGTALFFHSNLLHASNANLTPMRRRVLLISYNAISNALTHVIPARPQFLATRH